MHIDPDHEQGRNAAMHNTECRPRFSGLQCVKVGRFDKMQESADERGRSRLSFDVAITQRFAGYDFAPRRRNKTPANEVGASGRLEWRPFHEFYAR
jgi:hypothetical protein